MAVDKPTQDPRRVVQNRGEDWPEGLMDLHEFLAHVFVADPLPDGDEESDSNDLGTFQHGCKERSNVVSIWVR